MSLARLYKVVRTDKAIIGQLRSLLTDIKNVCTPQKVVVFGSAARNQMSGASDLDVAIILDNHEEVIHFRKKFRRSKIIYPLDILVFSQQEYLAKKDVGGVCFDIAVEGVEIFPNWEYAT